MSELDRMAGMGNSINTESYKFNKNIITYILNTTFHWFFFVNVGGYFLYEGKKTYNLSF
jgi:hypothetical protein